MLESILGYSPKTQHQNKLTASNVTERVNLAAVTVHPSHILWRAQQVIYIAMLVFAFIALLPFFLLSFYWLDMFYWIAIWLSFAFAIYVALRQAARIKTAASVRFEITKDNWRLTTNNGEFLVSPKGDVLLWSWLIIIPLRETLSGKTHHLIALPDSMTTEDWRRLCVWLKVCF